MFGTHVFPTAASDAVPWLTVDEMRRIDEVTVALGIELRQMMENAGRNLAMLARSLLGGDARGTRVRVLAGPGGNGGGGIAAARHLVVAGAAVEVVLGRPRDRLTPVTALQLAAFEAIGGSVAHGGVPRGRPDLVLDALLGYSLSGPPHPATATLLDETRDVPTISLDVPSGLELSTGIAHPGHVRPVATLTLAAPKTGLEPARGVAGTLYLADISVPPAAFRRIGRVPPEVFGPGPLVLLTP